MAKPLRPRTVQFSARWDADVVARLERLSEEEGENKSKLALRYVDEGTRMDDHPGIYFRGGPAGRRAALPGGPDVWEVISDVKSRKARGERAIEETADDLGLGVVKVRAAVRYHAEFGEEIDERIERNAREAEAGWESRREEQSAVS